MKETLKELYVRLKDLVDKTFRKDNAAVCRDCHLGTVFENVVS